MTTHELREAVAATRTRSAWDRGVKVYAFELVDSIEEGMRYEGWTELPCERAVTRMMLNGALDWQEFSEGGCTLVSDEEIARRLCSPSELRRNECGGRYPNARETWLMVQARALHHAAHLIAQALAVRVIATF